MSEWISVSERLPNMGVPVWMLLDDQIVIGCRNDGGEGWLWCDCQQYIYRKNGLWMAWEAEADEDYQPTHWMPLPEPPKP